MDEHNGAWRLDQAQAARGRNGVHIWYGRTANTSLRWVSRIILTRQRDWRNPAARPRRCVALGLRRQSRPLGPLLGGRQTSLPVLYGVSKF
ncbi:hypothetical protein JMJ77_0014524, partial [Colletotrichum scovillei]